jgi:hypothetical protein
MLHAYVERFDVMGGRGNILGWDGEVNKASIHFYVTVLENSEKMHQERLLNFGLELNRGIVQRPRKAKKFAM